MNFTKTKKVVAAGLSALMMMSSITSVFAAEPDSKTTTLNYEVSSRYDWMIHSTIDFGEDAGANKTVDRTGNQVKVLKNVIPEGKYLNISVKGSGANDAFTVDNGGSEVLNYDVSDDNGAVGVNGNVLSVPAGTNTATQNMGFKLNTTKKSAEVAGQYNGRVIYNASVGAQPLKGGTTLDIEGTKYVVLEERESNQALVMTVNSIGDRRTFQSTWRADDQNKSTYEGSEIGKVVNLKSPSKLQAFLNDITIWTRDSCQSGYSDVEVLFSGDGRLGDDSTFVEHSVRPAFVIDLSQVNYSVVK